MKKLLLAGLLIATILLLFISGCKIGGKAIALPNVTVTNIANFPYQFLTSTASTIGYASTMIFAPAAYSTEVTDLMNFMRLKACQLANSQGYGCVDSQGNPITGGAVFGLTGMSVAGQATPPDTRPIYRCWLNFHGVINHFVSFNSNCDGNAVDGLIGYLFTTQKSNTTPLYQCRRGVRHEHRTYYDNFVSTDANCEGQEISGLLGYASDLSAATYYDAKPVYRCWNRPDDISSSRYDHMISDSIGCEGYANEGTTFYFLKTEQVSLPPWDNGHACDADNQCNSNYCSPSTHVCEPITIPMYRCYYNFHGVLNHFLSKDQGCSGHILDHLVGYLIQPALQNTIPLYQCYRQTSYDIPGSGGERTYTDHFVAENSCPSGSTSEGLLGHSLMSEITDTTVIAYNCETIGGIRDSRFDHMVSVDIGCEATNYRNTGAKYYFLKTETLPATLPGPLPTELTKPVYRCLRNFHGVINHYVSFNQNCESGDSPEGLIGYVYNQPQDSTTTPVYQCHRAIRTARPGHEERTYHDHYLTKDQGCEGAGEFDGLIGYLPINATSETTTVYRCWTIDSIDAGRYDHMPSTDLACESSNYRNEGLIFNFLNTATPTGIPPPTPTLSGPGGACTQTSNCQTGYECLGGYCTTKRTLYACDGGYPSISSDCTDPNTGYSGSGKLIGYGLEPSINVPGTSQFGYCTDEYGSFAGLVFMETLIPCSRGFNSVVRVFNSQITGTVPLVSCSDYNNNYFIGSANAICPASYPIGGPSGKYIYPEPYCGDGNVVSPEQCEPPGTATCNAFCQNIAIIPPPPANITNVTNYTYIPPTTNTPPSTTPITITTNYIAIGTCADNLIIADSTYGLGSTVCANLMPGEAIIQLKQVGAITGLIIAGGSPADVNPAVQVLKNLTKWSAEGARLDVTNNAYLTTVGRLSSTAGAWRYNMEYRLPAGIHFIGVPFSIASKTIANNPAILSAAGGIFAYDAANNRSVKFDVDWPASPPLLSDLATFGNELEAYYVKTNTARTFMMPDASRTTTMTRNIPAAGWVAYTPYGKQKTLSQIVTTGIVNSLWCYENNQFVQKNLALNPTIDVGQGCWINLASGATLQ